MSRDELTHLELLAEVDSLLAQLRAWAEHAPDWPPAQGCQALVRRLVERADRMRVRFDAPLVVATLGGTGTGKSSLVNALVGDEVTAGGRERPTTRRATMICRPDIEPEDLGIDPSAVRVIQRDLPALRDLVLIDCPDPDTTEDPEAAGTNLARLRELLPHCDVLLITSTQQKYRSARVLDELATAARGAHLVFVQTHADLEEDVREDWRQVLEADYHVGEMFFVDSLSALADVRTGVQPRGDFGRLVELLTRELAGVAAARIRRANFLDLLEETLAACRVRLDAAMPALDRLEAALEEQRSILAAKLARTLRDELIASRRQWENRLLAEVASRWGFSPFALVLRAYLGLGGIVSASLLFRMRTPAQMALWGALEGGRRLRSRSRRRSAETGPSRALAWSWDEGDLRTAAIVLDGYVAEARLPRKSTQPDRVSRQATSAGTAFVNDVSAQVQGLISRLAKRHTGLITRASYELALGLMLAMLLYRLGRNFFYDSWLAAEQVPVYGMNFFVAAAFWLIVWCVILLGLFTMRLRRGLQGEIDQLALGWNTNTSAVRLFATLEEEVRAARQYRRDLDVLNTALGELNERFGLGDTRLGRRTADHAPPAADIDVVRASRQ